MVSYKNATNGQRFLAYIIDMILIGIITSFITGIIFTITGLTNDMLELFTEYMDVMIEYDEAYLNASSMAEQQLLDEQMAEVTLDFIVELTEIFVIMSYISIPVEAVLYVGYFIILPKFVSWQTIGRLAAKCKVVADDNSDVEWKHLILREGVGAFLLCYLLGGGLLQLVSGIVALAKGRSMIDYIGGTNLVSTKDVEYIQEEVSQEESEYRVY